MPHNPLENHTPLSNGGGQHQNQSYSNNITSRSPVHAVNKNRNKSALNLGSILNPVALTLQAKQPTDDIINQNGNDNNNNNNNSKTSDTTPTTNRTGVTGSYYKHSPTHVPMKQETILHNGVPFQPPVHMSHESTNGTNSHFSDATKATPIITNNNNNNDNNNNNGYTSDGDDSNSNKDNTQKQLPHRKRSKEKDTTVDCSTMTNNNINNRIVDNTNTPGTPTSEATLKWQPVETPQGHYQHHSGDQQYNNNNNNNGLPLTSGYHHHQQQSSTTSTNLEIRNSISTPMYTSANEFINNAMHGHHHHPHPPSYHQPESKQEPASTPLYDTHNRRSDSTSMYTGGVLSPTTHSGNNLYYYYHQYPTPESPSNNNSSLNTSSFFNSDYHYQGDCRKRSSLPLDYNNRNNQQSKRVRQNSEVVTSVYSMQPPPQPSCSMDSQQSSIIQEQSNPYYPFPQQSPPHHHHHHHHHPIYYHPQHPHAQPLPSAPPPSFSPTSIDSDNSMVHYHFQHNQQQYPHPPPALPPPTPPIKEKKKKKPKVSSEPGKPAKKGRPLKNTSSSSTIDQEEQPDAGSSLNSKETSTIISDLSPTSLEITTQTPTLSPTPASTKLNPTYDEEQVAKKIPKRRGRPPKTEAQKAADAAARAAAAAAAAVANPPSPSEKKKAAKKSTKQVTSKKAQQQQKEVKRYCTCQSPLTTPQYMISCDHCGEWFHGVCIGVSAKEGEFFDLYYCNECTAATGKKSTKRPPCANTFPGCQNPARASTKGSSRSKYCSEECGMRVARMRLERAQRAYESDHPNTATTTLERTLKGMLQAQEQDGKSQLNIDSNHWDMSRLAEMKQERIKARAIVQFVDIQARFLNKVLESQEENDPKMCGYDSRLSWQNNVWHAIKNISREGTDIKVELSKQAEVEDVDVEEFTLCNKIGKCQKHEHWRELRQSELEVERKKQIDILSSLDRKRKQIKSRISDRLKQPEGWTFLDNGTICHD